MQFTFIVSISLFRVYPSSFAHIQQKNDGLIDGYISNIAFMLWFLACVGGFPVCHNAL